MSKIYKRLAFSLFLLFSLGIVYFLNFSFTGQRFQNTVMELSGQFYSMFSKIMQPIYDVNVKSSGIFKSKVAEFAIWCCSEEIIHSIQNHDNPQIHNTIFSRDKNNIMTEDERWKAQDNNVITKSLFPSIDSILLENSDLRIAAKFIKKSTFELITARIIYKDHLLHDDNFMLLDAGSRQGVEHGNVIINSDGFLVGRVEAVSDNISKVVTIKNMMLNIPAILSASGERCMIRGIHINGRELLLASYARSQHNIKVGEKIITSGEGTMIPYGILIGKIIGNSEDGIEDDYNHNKSIDDLVVSDSVLVEPAVDFNKLRLVHVILPLNK